MPNFSTFRNIFLRFLIFLFAISFGCKKDDPTKIPKLSTLPINQITTNSAKGGGNISNDGGAKILSRGLVWGANINPTTEQHIGITADGSGTGIYVSEMNDLTPNTVYYVRAYAINKEGIAYGNELEFKTEINLELPILSTKNISEVTPTTAKCGGNLISDGNSPITSYGVCWSQQPNPTILSNKTNDGSGLADFISHIEELEPNTQYYVRAYATNSIGTGYGNEVVFNTEIATEPPTINTNSVTSITQINAISGGNIISDGNSPVTSRGVCWSKESNPTIDDFKSLDGDGNGLFSSSLTDLEINTIYYVRAYATNNAGTSYGNEESFKTLDGVIDIDNNIYNVVTIGNQTWMKENLKTTRYSDGTLIPFVTNSAAWSALNYSDKAYSWYNDDEETYGEIYGALYNWAAVMNGSLSSSSNPSGVQGVCPVGWHVPSAAEWIELENYLISNGFGYGGSGAQIGKSLAAKSYWTYSPTPENVGNDLTTNNSSGFSGLPAGNRWSSGGFANIGEYTGWWSSLEIDSEKGNDRGLDYGGSVLFDFGNNKRLGFSVRCVRD